MEIRTGLDWTSSVANVPWSWSQRTDPAEEQAIQADIQARSDHQLEGTLESIVFSDVANQLKWKHGVSEGPWQDIHG